MRNAVMKTAILILFATLQPAYAQAPISNPAQRPHYSPTQQLPDPSETIQQGAKRLQAFISSDALSDPKQVGAFIESELSPFFDFDTMSRLVLGPLNHRVNAQQRQGVTAMIKRTFLTALASNLANYQGGKINYTNISGNINRGRVNVRLAIYMPDQYPTMLELRFVANPKGWKIIDVSANGMSAVAHYRNYVQSVVQRSGLEGLLQ